MEANGNTRITQASRALDQYRDRGSCGGPRNGRALPHELSTRGPTMPKYLPISSE